MATVVYFRITRYYCPYCDHETSLFTWKPILIDRWVCRNCRKAILLDTKAIADNWVNTLSLWAMPPSFLFGLVVSWNAMAGAINIPQLLLFTLIMTVATVAIVYVLLMPVGLIAGAVIRQWNASAPRGRRKYIVRELS